MVKDLNGAEQAASQSGSVWRDQSEEARSGKYTVIMELRGGGPDRMAGIRVRGA